MQNGNRLDEYLGEIERRLRPLSPVEREEELREARLHLEALRDKLAQEENAADPDSATIRQFGTAEVVAGKILAAWRRGHRGAFRSAFFHSMGLWSCCAWQIWNTLNLLDQLYNPPYALWQGRTEMRHNPQQWSVPAGVTISLILLYLLGAGVLSGRLFRGAIAARGAAWGFVAALAFEMASSFNQLPSLSTFLASDVLLPRLFLAFLTLILGTYLGSLLRPLSLRPFGFWSVLIQYLAAVCAVGVVSWLAWAVALHHQWLPEGQIVGIRWVEITSLIPHVASYIVAGILMGRRAKQNPAKLVLAVAAIAGLNFVSLWFMTTGQDLRFWGSNASFVLRSFERLGYNVGGALILALVAAIASALAFRQANNRAVYRPL